MSSEELKETGNKSFQNKDYKAALQWFVSSSHSQFLLLSLICAFSSPLSVFCRYEKALAASPSSAALHSNISATLFCLKQFNEALNAADECIAVEPTWEKVSHFNLCYLTTPSLPPSFQSCQH